MSDKNEKPAITIVANSAIEEELLAQIEYGMEEEGIPWERVVDEASEVTELSYKAAQISKLGVGLGMNYQNEVALHGENMDKNTPVFKKKIINSEEAKLIGSNAAKMVKRLPFKGIFD